MGRRPTPRVRHVAVVQGTAFGLNPRTPPLERLPLRFSVKGSASPQSSPGRPAGAAASGLALDPAPTLSRFWNGEGVKGSWNTAGSAATEDMPRKPLDAFGMTHAPVMGVGGFKAVGRPPAPMTTEGDSFPRRGRRGRFNSRKAAHPSPTAMLLKGWGSRYGGGRSPPRRSRWVIK